MSGFFNLSHSRSNQCVEYGHKSNWRLYQDWSTTVRNFYSVRENVFDNFIEVCFGTEINFLNDVYIIITFWEVAILAVSVPAPNSPDVWIIVVCMSELITDTSTLFTKFISVHCNFVVKQISVNFTIFFGELSDINGNGLKINVISCCANGSIKINVIEAEWDAVVTVCRF